jgi:hypothetical protein
MYKIIGADGKEYGPISVEQLRQWVAEGRANAQTRVLPEGQTEWKTVAEVPELAVLVTAAPSPAMPTTPLPMPGSQPQKANPLAITGLVLGILALPGACCCYGIPFNIPGIVVSIIALSQIKKEPDRYTGRGMALAGLILSIVGIVLAIALLVFGVAMSGSDWMRKLQNRG